MFFYALPRPCPLAQAVGPTSRSGPAAASKLELGSTSLWAGPLRRSYTLTGLVHGDGGALDGGARQRLRTPPHFPSPHSALVKWRKDQIIHSPWSVSPHPT